MSLLVRSEILHFLINTLSATGKYSRYDGKNFKQPVQMELFNTCYLTHYLTHGLPMASILVIIERISSDQFKWNYLRNQMFFHKISLRS